MKVDKSDSELNHKTPKGRMQIIQILGFIVLPILAMIILYFLIHER